MNISEISAALEAVLFACGSPVQKERLTELFDLTGDELTEAAESLRERLNSRTIRLHSFSSKLPRKRYTAYLS